jgi:uncharacterized Rmd1/YagE family protein
MAAIPVHAYGFAATFKLRELVSAFAPEVEARVEKDRLLAVLGPSRWVLAYDFGALVFVGVEPAERERVVAAVVRRLPVEPNPPLTEDFLIEDHAGPTFEVRFDRVLVPEITLDVVDIVALILAQSVAMDYYGRDVYEIEENTDRLAAQLRATGRIPGKVRDLIQFIGLCIATRNDVISTLALFDKPDATWENEQLDRLWMGLYRVLELDDRYRALEAKLRMFQDNLMVLVDLTRARQSLVLETLVVALIVFETMLMVWQILKASGHA